MNSISPARRRCGETIRYECVLTKNGEKIANGSMTIACVQKKPVMRGIEIPEQVRSRLSA
jgi:acyl-CoA thioesterase FadM